MLTPGARLTMIWPGTKLSVSRAWASCEAPGNTSMLSARSSATTVARDCVDALVTIFGSRDLVVRLPDCTYFSRGHYRPCMGARRPAPAFPSQDGGPADQTPPRHFISSTIVKGDSTF